MNEQHLSYKERLTVAWLLLWRGLLISVALGFIFGFIVGIVLPLLGFPHQLAQSVAGIGGGLIGLFYVYPLAVGMMMRKRFKGFGLQVVREA